MLIFHTRRLHHIPSPVPLHTPAVWRLEKGPLVFFQQTLSLCKTILCGAVVLLIALSDIPSGFAQKSHPAWLDHSVIYCVYPEIFSPDGFQGVTAQLSRIKKLGANVIWLMPITPAGQPYHGHPAIDSPYAVHDYYAVNPRYGSSADLKRLVSTAHSLGMKVILDEVLNHTSWDNPLTSEHPEFYRHTDGDSHNINSEQQAFTWSDVAQLDYGNRALWTYMDAMLRYWITTYDVDGFRFDTADDPSGAGREIPQAFWVQLRPGLESVKPDILMLGEEENPALARAPFELDYGWKLLATLKQTAKSGNSAPALEETWRKGVVGWPSGMLHLAVTQDWDTEEDLKLYGGVPNALDAALFNYTINGVPLMFNGEEVGNDRSGNNTHTQIDWNSPNAARFTRFYAELLALRNGNAALQQGGLAWIPNSAGSTVATYQRSGGGSKFLVEVNFGDKAARGTVTVENKGSWEEVTPSGGPGGRSHPSPGRLSLQAHDFAVFRRSLSTFPDDKVRSK